MVNEEALYMEAARIALSILMEKFGVEIVAAYIYGSVARGDFTRNSDVDIHLVVKNNEVIKRMPEYLWIDNVKVDISPHHVSFYETSPQWILNNVEIAAKWEGLWELRDVIILHDPHGIVSSFRAKILPILDNEELIRVRAKASLNDAEREYANARDLLDKNILDKAVVHMYLLRGGGGSSGALPSILKSIIKLSGLPLTVRRIWIRFRSACSRLSMTDIMDLVRKGYGFTRIESKWLIEELNELLEISNSLPIDKRNLMLFKSTILELIDEKEFETAYVFMIGSTALIYQLIQNNVPPDTKKQLEGVLLKIANVSSPSQFMNRLEVVEGLIEKLKKHIK